MDHLRTGTLPLLCGTTLSYAEQGDPRAPAIVLLHGYGDSWPSFAPLMAALRPDRRVVALTMRGHGASAKPEHGYTTAGFAVDVVDAMDRLGIEAATMVGHSMGSLVAQRVAIERPSCVSRLVLIGAFATLKGNPAVDALWRDEVSTLADPVDPAFVRGFQRASLAGPVAEAFFEGVVAESLRVPARVWRDTLDGLRAESHVERLQRIDVPTLVIWGDQDSFAGHAEQEILIQRIRDARLLVHRGVGHAPHWENPRRVAAELLAFVEAEDRKAA